MFLKCSHHINGWGGMMRASNNKEQSAFSWWLRTGRLPPVRNPEGAELKFNPWHDPADGRFTFAGSGHTYGAGGAGSANRASVRKPGIVVRDKRRIATMPKAGASQAGQQVRYSKRTAHPAPITARPKPASESRPNASSNPAVEFAGGVGEGLYDVAKGTVLGAYSTLTTNPVTTIRNVGREIAGTIDRAIAAEDTPARVQIARAANAVANASAREIGHATGTVVGNVALSAVPGAALGKVSAFRQIRKARPRTAYPPPQIGWVKETIRSDKPWSAYNNSATGARPGQAPTLMRTLPDGSKRPVKFDGVEGSYMIDRKWSVTGKPRAVAQILRQSEVLAQHRLIGTWEVPNQAQRNKAIKLFKKLNVTNIKVRVVEP
jgi:hypothetical protein